MKNSRTKKSFLILNLLTVFFLLFAFEARANSNSSKETEIQKCRELYNQKTQKSWDKAAEICGDLAFNGNGEAQYYTGMIIKNSPNISNRDTISYGFFHSAIENKEDRAIDEIKNLEKNMTGKQLGVAYIAIVNDYYSLFVKSKMVKKDDKKSFEFLSKSAELGSPTGQDGLCASYALGFHGNFKFQKNYIQAYKWCYLANIDPEIKNNPKSQKVFEKLKSLMTKDQIKQGQKLAEEWIKNNPDLVNNRN